MSFTVKGTSCCGMEFFGFRDENCNCPECVANRGGKSINTEFSYSMLKTALNTMALGALVIFSGNEAQSKWTKNGYIQTPEGFAQWLEAEGEAVTRGPWAINVNTRNRIQAYIWAPSAKFRLKLAELPPILGADRSGR